jgi:hypothetical protein
MDRNRTEDDGLTEEQRLRDIARTLAAGILRLRARALSPPAATSPPCPQIVAESGPNCLDVPPETVLSVQTG